MRSFRIVLLFGVAALKCITAGAQSTAIPASRAVKTLVDSNSLSVSLEGPDKNRDRIAYLVRLTRASAKIAPTLTEEWCEELFSLASQSPLNWDRVANQKNAAVPLAAIDPKRAMELLGKVDRPQPHTIDHTFTEDVRADAAATIFPAFVQAHTRLVLNMTQALARVRGLAKKIGDTGEYPYRAMSRVLDLAEVKESTEPGVDEQTQGIFHDGLIYYKRHSQFEDEEDEFFNLLQMGKYAATSRSYREALIVFINRVSVPSKTHGAYVSKVKPAQGTVVRLDDENKELLWRVLPLVANVDREWSQKLIEKNPELAQATAGVEQIGAAFIPGTPSKEFADRASIQLLDKALLPRIESLSKDKTNLTEAISKANSITTLPARIIAFSYVVTAIAPSDPALAQQMYSRQVEDFSRISNGIDQLKAKVAIAKSAYILHDQEKFNALSSQILETGTVLFAGDTKHFWTDLRDGYREMAEIVEFSASHDIPEMLNKVNGLDNALLKAHLLIFEARGFQEAEQALAVAASR